MDSELNNKRLEELANLTEEIDRKVKILSHSKTSMYQSIADIIMDDYAYDIRDQVDEVFAISANVSHDPESATYKSVEISIELASNIDDVEEELELQHEVREEIYDKFPDIKNLRTIIRITFDL